MIAHGHRTAARRHALIGHACMLHDWPKFVSFLFFSFLFFSFLFVSFLFFSFIFLLFIFNFLVCFVLFYFIFVPMGTTDDDARRAAMAGLIALSDGRADRASSFYCHRNLPMSS